MNDPLVPATFLYRFSVPCLYHQKIWSRSGVQLGEEYRLPHLAELDGAPQLADVRLAWSEFGFAFNVRVQGKRQLPWCRESQLEESDGLHVWIDTRDTHNIHRASRFCHWFALLPTGGGSRRAEPTAGQLIINRARENAKPALLKYLPVRSEIHEGGYLLEGCVLAEAMTGWDPSEHTRIGFCYAVVDRERGDQTFTVGHEFPYREDPSVWGTLELVK